MRSKGYAVIAISNSDDRFVARCAMRVRGRLERVFILEDESGSNNLERAEKILSEYMGIDVSHVRVLGSSFWKLVWDLRKLITDLLETGYRVKVCMNGGSLLPITLLLALFILPREVNADNVVIELGLKDDACTRFNLNQIRALASLNLQQQTVLDVLWMSLEPASLTSLVKETSVPKSTLHRILMNLQKAGVVDRLGDKYVLSAAMRENIC